MKQAAVKEKITKEYHRKRYSRNLIEWMNNGVITLVRYLKSFFK